MADEKDKKPAPKKPAAKKPAAEQKPAAKSRAKATSKAADEKVQSSDRLRTRLRADSASCSAMSPPSE